MTQQATELIATQLGSAISNQRTWGTIIYNVKDPQYGAIGSPSDDTVPIQKAIDAAIAANSKSIFFPSGTYSATALIGLDQVNLIGDNATLTVSGDSKKVEQLGLWSSLDHTSAIYARAIEEMGILPKDSLTRAKKAINETKTLKISFFGDSITENGGGDVNDLNDKYANRVQSIIKTNLPNGVSLTFNNYGLGGRKLSQAVDANYKGLAAEPSDLSLGFYRSWSTVGKSWRDTVRDSSPDLLVVAFGMNDAMGTVGLDEAFYNNLTALDAYISTWTIIPSIVIVPTFIPTEVMSRYGQRQDVTFAVARATREYAKQKGYIIADANRLYSILHFGKDDVSRANSSEFNFNGFGTSKWNGSTSSFDLIGTTLSPKSGVIGKTITRNKSYYNGFISVDMNPSAQGAAGLARIEYRSSDLGKLVVIVTPSNVGTGSIELYFNSTQLAFFNTLTIPTGSYTNIKIESDGMTHSLYVGGLLKFSFTTPKLLSDGVVTLGGDNAIPTFNNLQIGYRDPIQGTPIYNESELIGDFNNPYQDGNGINHPNGQGHALFYVPGFFGVIKELAKVEEKGQYLATRILPGTWAVPGAGYPLTTTAGEKLYFATIPRYEKSRGIAYRELTNGTYYGLSTVAVSQATLASLEPGKFVYYNSDATSDLIFISVPSAGTVTWSSDLFMYQNQK